MLVRQQLHICDILINRNARSTLQCQLRTLFSRHNKHGPGARLNPVPEVDKWIKEAFTIEGFKHTKNLVVERLRSSCELKLKRVYEYGKIQIFEHFDNDNFLKTWKVGADSDSLHGYSYAQLTRSRSGHALFSGVLDNRIPNDGLTENSGFAALIGPSAVKTKLIQLHPSHDWRPFNAFEIRFRGDGRLYQLVVNTASYLSDTQFYDNYVYPLPTRGGPYWQTIRIPFTKFVLTAKNCPQDQQSSLAEYKVKFVAVNLQDKIDGPFALEIDYMGLVRDWYIRTHDEPYEHYQYAHIKYKQLAIGTDPPGI